MKNLLKDSLESFVRACAISCIRVYQHTMSPRGVFGSVATSIFFVAPIPACRFYPSCSEYAATSISQYGLLEGIVMSCKRILKCHPFSPGGYDPVRMNKEQKNN